MTKNRRTLFAESLLEGAKDAGVIKALQQGLNRTPAPPAAVAEQKAGKVSIRVPRPRKTPQTEIEYGKKLGWEYKHCRVDHNGWSARLPGGIRYTPDFTVWDGSRMVMAVEVKGPVRLQSSARSYAAFKIAIEWWPMIVWRFAEKQESGEWAVRDYNKQTP